jgi:hypothetical protein
MDFDCFDKEFDRDLARVQRMVIFGFVVSTLLSLAVLGGLTFVAYKVLVHFGIL